MGASPLHLSKTSEWMTPGWLVEKSRDLAPGRKFDLDPASNEMANSVIEATRYYTVDQDGLAQDWTWAQSVFVNPPGDRSGRLPKAFFAKLCDWMRTSPCPRLAVWVGFSLNQLQTLQAGADRSFDAVCVPSRRVCYLDSSGRPQTQPTHPSFIGFMGSRATKERLERHFGDVGLILWNGRFL